MLSFEYGVNANLAGNRDRNSFHVGQDFLVAKSNHLPAFRFQEGLSLAVVLLLKIVVSAIELDEDVSFDTGKVDEVRPDRMLTAKL